MMIFGFLGYQNLSKHRTYKLKPGEVSTALPDGRIVVAHLDRDPKIVHADGSETYIVNFNDPEPSPEKRN